MESPLNSPFPCDFSNQGMAMLIASRRPHERVWDAVDTGIYAPLLAEDPAPSEPKSEDPAGSSPAQIDPAAKPHPKAATHSQMSKLVKHWKRKSAGWRREAVALASERDILKEENEEASEVIGALGVRQVYLELKCARLLNFALMDLLSDPDIKSEEDRKQEMSALAFEIADHLDVVTRAYGAPPALGISPVEPGA